MVQPLRPRAEAAHLSTRPGRSWPRPPRSLPAPIGGARNWDYRYTWIRDASFTLYGLMRIGFTEEADAFMRWLWARVQETERDGSLQLMYAIDGRHELAEQTLDHLEGYRGSRPVRIGNAAYHQLQLDIYGELMDAVYLYNKYAHPDRLRRLGEDPADPQPRVRRVARARRGDLGGARRPPPLRLLEAHVLGRARPRAPPRRQALLPGGPAALAREPGRDLRGDHEPGLEPRAAGLRAGLRQRRASTRPT